MLQKTKTQLRDELEQTKKELELAEVQTKNPEVTVARVGIVTQAGGGGAASICH